MSTQKQALSVIVPTLNEAENLPLLFKRIDATLRSAGIPYEIVIIDDHSTDTTLRVAKKAQATYPIRIATKIGKRGKAYSLIQGFAAAKYDLLCMIDADLQYPPEAITAMYTTLMDRNIDIVITERYEEKSPLLRRISSKVFSIVFARILFGLNYDTQSGLKLFKKNVIETISIKPSPWSFDLEFIVRSLEAGFKIDSHRIQFAERYRGQAKISVLKATFELASASLKLRAVTSGKLLRTKYKQNAEYLRMPSMFIVGAALVIGCIVFGSSRPVSALSLNQSKTVASITMPSDTANVLGEVKSLLGMKSSTSTPSAPSTPTTTTPSQSSSPSSTTTTNNKRSTAASTSTKKAASKTPMTAVNGTVEVTPGTGSTATIIMTNTPSQVGQIAVQTGDDSLYTDSGTSKGEESLLSHIAQESFLGGLLVIGIAELLRIFRKRFNKTVLYVVQKERHAKK
jgi:glycosyltransferase involved in cell wall biosynthesis